MQIYVRPRGKPDRWPYRRQPPPELHNLAVSRDIREFVRMTDEALQFALEDGWPSACDEPPRSCGPDEAPVPGSGGRWRRTQSLLANAATDTASGSVGGVIGAAGAAFLGIG